MKNVCIVGYGSIGVIHEYALSCAKNARLYAVCDIDVDKLKSAPDNLVKYSNFEQVLYDANIDCIHICTPHYLHFDMAKNALEHGKFVVLEKPAVMRKEELEKLLHLDGKENIAMVFQNRLNPCAVKLKKMINDGSLGRVISAKVVLTWHRDADYYARDYWRGKLSTEGGGVMINQAIHTLDLIGYVTGDFKSAKARIMNFSIPEIEVEDTCCAYLKLENGVNCILFVTNAYGCDDNPEIEIVTEKSKILYSAEKLTVDGNVVEQDISPKIGKECWGSGHKKLIENLYDRNIYFGTDDIKNTMYALFAIYESAEKSGTEISIPCFR